MSTAAGPTAVPNRLVLAAFVLLIFLGGSNGVAVRFSNSELPPFWGAALRFGLSALIFWAICLAIRPPLPRGRALLGATIYGLLSFGGGYAFAYWSLVHVPAGVGQVVLGLVPLMTMFLAIAHRQERFSWRALTGALIAVAGIALAFQEQMSANVPLGPLLGAVASGLCIAEAAVVARHFPRSHPVATNALGMTVGTLFLLLVSLVAGERWFLPTTQESINAVIFLVIVGSVMVFALYLYVLTHWTASATTYSFVLFPFVTVIVAALLAGEPVTPAITVGAVLVLVGVYVGALMGSLAARRRNAEAAQAAADSEIARS